MHSFDTSVLINGRRDLLPPVVFVTAWRNIEQTIAAGGVRCVDVVSDELTVRDDEVSRWAKTQTGLFVPLSEELQQATSDVLRAHLGWSGSAAGAAGRTRSSSLSPWCTAGWW